MKKPLLLSVILLLTVSILSGTAALILKTVFPGDEPPVESEASDTSERGDSVGTDNSVPSPPGTGTSSPPPVDPPSLSALAEAAGLSAPQLFVYSVSESRFLYEKGTDRPILPASITKLLTALFALESMPADTVIQPGNELELVGTGSSLAYIKTWHRLTLEMLIEGMLLPSGNDAAYAVAAATARHLTGNKKMDGSAAVAYFMEKLNEYARSIGCTGTYYQVPDGLIYDNHYTTAKDLAVIAKRALENEIIMKYAGTVRDKVFYESGETMTWNNSNQLIHPDSPYYRSCVTGLKTGSLTDSYSILLTARIDGHDYVIGVFGAPDSSRRFSDAAGLVDVLTIFLKQTDG